MVTFLTPNENHRERRKEPKLFFRTVCQGEYKQISNSAPTLREYRVIYSCLFIITYTECKSKHSGQFFGGAYSPDTIVGFG